MLSIRKHKLSDGFIKIKIFLMCLNIFILCVWKIIVEVFITIMVYLFIIPFSGFRKITTQI